MAFVTTFPRVYRARKPTLPSGVRRRIAETIDRLIALLDAHDPESDEEPWLGAPEQRPSETVCIDGRWSTWNTSQGEWATGNIDDREGDLADSADDREGEDVLDTGEETLGWPANVSQRHLGENCVDGDTTAPERHGDGFVRCGADDYEASDSGIGDSDGLNEQMTLCGMSVLRSGVT